MHEARGTEEAKKEPTLYEQIVTMQSTVGKYFPIYGIRFKGEILVFNITCDDKTLDSNFEKLRIELKEIGYIPMITYSGGEYTIQIIRKPKMKYRSVWVNILFLILTIISTVFAGMNIWSDYVSSKELLLLSNFTNGTLFFAMPLMVILGVHEMGHFIVARKHNVAASLPFFIPAPFTIFGTFGAFISLRDPIPNRKGMLDIGIAGPLAGFFVAVPVTFLGLYLTSVTSPPAELTPPTTGLGSSLLFSYITDLFPLPEYIILHPLALAGWVGFFVTGLNLLPAGQLDGGHIIKALLGDKSKYVNYGTILFLMGLGIFSVSWLIFAFIIIILGLKHPPPLNDLIKLAPSRNVLGAFAIALLVLTFTIFPFVPIKHDFRLSDGTTHHVFSGNNTTFNITIKNTGEAWDIYIVSLKDPVLTNKSAPINLTDIVYVLYDVKNFTKVNNTNDTLSFRLEPNDERILKLDIYIPSQAKGGNEFQIKVEVRSIALDRVQTQKFQVIVDELSFFKNYSIS